MKIVNSCLRREGMALLDNRQVAAALTRDEVLVLVASAVQSQDDDIIGHAVRSSLDWFAKMHPGKAVEVRIPPYRVVQVLGGTTHRRGTPPAIVEMNAQTWLGLCVGALAWDQCVATGYVQASGERSNLGEYLPITNVE